MTPPVTQLPTLRSLAADVHALRLRVNDIDSRTEDHTKESRQRFDALSRRLSAVETEVQELAVASTQTAAKQLTALAEVQGEVRDVTQAVNALTTQVMRAIEIATRADASGRVAELKAETATAVIAAKLETRDVVDRHQDERHKELAGDVKQRQQDWRRLAFQVLGAVLLILIGYLLSRFGVH